VKWYQAVAGSGDKQAKAKLCRLEIEEVAVAFGPSTSCKVITEAAHCPLLSFPSDCWPTRIFRDGRSRPLAVRINWKTPRSATRSVIDAGVSMKVTSSRLPWFGGSARTVIARSSLGQLPRPRRAPGGSSAYGSIRLSPGNAVRLGDGHA
jgi:hypothetical protein